LSNQEQKGNCRTYFAVVFK